MNPNPNSFSTNYPLIPNAKQYFIENKYISIHSEDRDYSKFPNSSEFELTFPQHYENIVSARLYNWSFPSNYNVFSVFSQNVLFVFQFNTLYNPSEHGLDDPLNEGIYNALLSYGDSNFIVNIEPGFYNPEQMATELTNKMNYIVTQQIFTFFESHLPEYQTVLDAFSNYARFVVVYDSVSQKLWFGNKCDQFTFPNDSVLYSQNDEQNLVCSKRRANPSFADWGLPAYLGFTCCPMTSHTVEEGIANDPSIDYIVQLPRFYHGDAIVGSGDGGFWLEPDPDLVGTQVTFFQAPFKISFMGPSYIYMEIDGMNCIDETSPWAMSSYTSHNNQTNGVANSSFAKIAVPITPISQWFDSDMGPYKYWNPPEERISKIKFRFRYHNGKLVDFGQYEYSFVLEFKLLRPQHEPSYSIRSAAELSQYQSNK